MQGPKASFLSPSLATWFLCLSVSPAKISSPFPSCAILERREGEGKTICAKRGFSKIASCYFIYISWETRFLRTRLEVTGAIKEIWTRVEDKRETLGEKI